MSRLREAGAVIIGKCNLHELALGTTSDESAFGPVHNPRDVSRSPGGSSGGSAAAVAAGMGWASIGTDTGGSIRIPAAACGVVGLKPTFGEIPTTGVVPLSVSLDHVGPDRPNGARCVGDLRGSRRRAAIPPVAVESVQDLRIGKLGGYFLEKLDTGVRAAFRGSARPSEGGRRHHHGRSTWPIPDIATTYVNVALPEAFAYYAETLEKAPDAFSSGIRERLRDGEQDFPRRIRESARRSGPDARRRRCRAFEL